MEGRETRGKEYKKIFDFIGNQNLGKAVGKLISRQSYRKGRLSPFFKSNKPHFIEIALQSNASLINAESDKLTCQKITKG